MSDGVYQAADDAYGDAYRLGADHGDSLNAAVDAIRAPLLAELDRLKHEQSVELANAEARADVLTEQVAQLTAKLEAVDALAPANALIRKLRAETDAANAALIDSLQVEAIDQRARAERAEAEAERLKANQLPDGAIIAPEDIAIIRRDIDGEILGYRYSGHQASHHIDGGPPDIDL